jgi:hypothetical protein
VLSGAHFGLTKTLRLNLKDFIGSNSIYEICRVEFDLLKYFYRNIANVYMLILFYVKMYVLVGENLHCFFSIHGKGSSQLKD